MRQFDEDREVEFVDENQIKHTRRDKNAGKRKLEKLIRDAKRGKIRNPLVLEELQYYDH